MESDLLWGGSEPTPTVTEQQPLYADTLENDLGQSAPIAQGQSNRSIAHCNRKPRPTLSNPTWSAPRRLLQASVVDSIIESNPEMNYNQIAGLIYAGIAENNQNATQNNQGSGLEDQGTQGEIESAGTETQAAAGEVASAESSDGQPASGAGGQAGVPASGGVVQPGRTGTDTVGAEDGGTTDPAVALQPEALTLDQEQDGTTPQATDPNAETRAQVNRERDFFGLETPEGNTSNVGMGGRQDDMVGAGTNETEQQDQRGRTTRACYRGRNRHRCQRNRHQPSPTNNTPASTDEQKTTDSMTTKSAKLVDPVASLREALSDDVDVAPLGVALFRVTPNAGGGVRLQDAIRKVRSITSEWTVFADRSTHVVATFADLPADVQKAGREGGSDKKVKGIFH